MTPADKNIVRALCAVAWADGQMEGSEGTVVEGLLAGFDASDDEEAEIVAWARTPRTLDDLDLAGLSRDDKELLLGNAALLTHADGEVSESERAILARLSGLLGFGDAEAREIVESVRGGARSAG